MTDPVAAGETSRTIRKRPSFKMSQRSVRFLWAVALLAFLGVALVLGFVVALASGETALYERNFVWLFWINAVVALALLIVLVGATIRLGVRWHSGKFGSRLLLKLAAIFALVGVVPGACGSPMRIATLLALATRSADSASSVPLPRFRPATSAWSTLVSNQASMLRVTNCSDTV